MTPRLDPITAPATGISELQLSLLLTDAMADLHDQGIFIRQTSDFDDVFALAERIEKPYFTQFLSPKENDFFESNGMWLTFHDADQSPLGIVGARMDDTGAQSLAEFYRQRKRKRDPKRFDQHCLVALQPAFAERIRGKIVYEGDFFLTRRASKTGLRHLQKITFILHVICRLHWPDLDWFYAFLRDRDVARGAAAAYGFTQQHAMANSWTVDPAEASFEHTLVGMAREDFDAIAARRIAVQAAIKTRAAHATESSGAFTGSNVTELRASTSRETV